MTAKMKLPAGFRFHPTDEELVVHYLCPKCASQPISVPVIADIHLYNFDPWLLPGMALYGEKEWYFFSPRDRKYPNGSRPNRAAGTGYWKATGADKPIGKPKTIGIKKALVFYSGKSPKGIKTNWIMHEYRLANVDRSPSNKTNLRLDDWVLCRIYNKKGIIEKGINLDQKRMVQNSDHFDGQKPVTMPPGHNSRNDHLHFDTSESGPHCHTDTSGSVQVALPEFVCDREVRNEPNSNDTSMNMSFTHESYPFNYMESFPTDQMSNFQDVLMFLR